MVGLALRTWVQVYPHCFQRLVDQASKVKDRATAQEPSLKDIWRTVAELTSQPNLGILSSSLLLPEPLLLPHFWTGMMFGCQYTLTWEMFLKLISRMLITKTTFSPKSWNEIKMNIVEIHTPPSDWSSGLSFFPACLTIGLVVPPRRWQRRKSG